eukprot:scaffold576_cov260-Pinguiococcus_pyrenoidosus.AAC.107
MATRRGGTGRLDESMHLDGWRVSSLLRRQAMLAMDDDDLDAQLSDDDSREKIAINANPDAADGFVANQFRCGFA